MPENKTDEVKVENITTILKRNVTLHTENKNKEQIDINERFVEGINIFLLSSHYHPDGLQRILEIPWNLPQCIKVIMGTKITELFQDHNNESLELDTIQNIQ